MKYWRLEKLRGKLKLVKLVSGPLVGGDPCFLFWIGSIPPEIYSSSKVIIVVIFIKSVLYGMLPTAFRIIILYYMSLGSSAWHCIWVKIERQFLHQEVSRHGHDAHPGEHGQEVEGIATVQWCRTFLLDHRLQASGKPTFVVDFVWQHRYLGARAAF